MLGGAIRPLSLRIDAQCQEKPIDEAFPALTAHATVVVDVSFEVGEDALQPVVGIGHSIDLEPSEQIRQIEADTGHSRAQPPVRVGCRSRLGVDGSFLQEGVPLDGPSLKGRSETIPVAGCQRGHQRLQLTSCRKPRVTRELPSDNGAHVILAHLHFVALKEREQRMHSVYDYAVNHIAVTLDPGEGLGIIRGALMSDVLEVQRPPASRL